MKTVILDRQRDGCYSDVTNNNKYISRVCCIATGSCRPFQRSSQMQYEYELRRRELFVSVVFQVLCMYTHLPILKFRRCR